MGRKRELIDTSEGSSVLILSSNRFFQDVDFYPARIHRQTFCRDQDVFDMYRGHAKSATVIELELPKPDPVEGISASVVNFNPFANTGHFHRFANEIMLNFVDMVGTSFSE